MHNNNQPCDNNLLKIFNLKNTLEIRDEQQLFRVRKKIDILINSKKLDFLFVTNENKHKTAAAGLSNIKFKNIPKSLMNELYYKEVVIKNAAFGFISFATYLFFDKYSNYLHQVNSIYYYKKLFLLTYCFVPILLNFAFSKMNYEYRLLELKLGKDINSHESTNKTELRYY